MPSASVQVPYLTADQMREEDRAMMQDYHIELIQIMENAGRNLAHVARLRFLNGDPRDKQVIVLAGTGGNGGGALVAARHLSNWGAHVDVYVTQPADQFAPVPAHQLDIPYRMQVPIAEAQSLPKATRADLIVDGVIGYSLRGAPHATAAELIRWANGQGVPVLALDAPSGVDTTRASFTIPRSERRRP
jgi:NAD(P)H-hydrate epimerase